MTNRALITKVKALLTLMNSLKTKDPKHMLIILHLKRSKFLAVIT